MKHYMIMYVGAPKEVDEATSKLHFERWQAWVNDLGDSAINPGTPLLPSKTVTEQGVHETAADKRISGYSVVAAESLDAACKIAQRCPFLEMGVLEVAEITQMS